LKLQPAKSVENLVSSNMNTEDEINKIESIVNNYIKNIDNMNLSVITKEDKEQLENETNIIIENLNKEIVKISNDANIDNSTKLKITNELYEEINKLKLENNKLEKHHHDPSHSSKEEQQQPQPIKDNSIF